MDRAKLYLHAQAYLLDLESVGLVEYIGVGVLKPKEVSHSSSLGGLERKAEAPYQLDVVEQASRKDIEERVSAMAVWDFVLPVKLGVWNKAIDYFQSKSANFSGLADSKKLEDLGLYDKSRKFVRVYADGEFTLPSLKKGVKEGAAALASGAVAPTSGSGGGPGASSG